ncbi:MAG: TetR family transcriptional regulator [Blastopirellula sp.]|nr:MAG: TetR family transcriptional regulator [Blastopirellula sp.]
MKLFESQGYFATTVEQITAEAGVSKGLVYNYFNSKEELLAGLIEETTTRMESVAQTLDPGESVEDSLSQFIDHYFHFLKTEKTFLKLQLTLMLMPELKKVVSQPQQQRAKSLLKMLTGWFKQANASGAKNKARLFLAMLDGVALHYLSIYENYPLISMKPLLMQAAKELCSPPEGN